MTKKIIVILSVVLILFSCSEDKENSIPVCTISKPSHNYEYFQDEEIEFACLCEDADQTLFSNNVVWTSDKDGELFEGSYFIKADLSVNTHTITLTVTDNEGAKAKDSVIVKVLPREDIFPRAEILLPLENSAFLKEETISFSGTGKDQEDGFLSGNNLKWSSNIQGELGFGNSFELNTLSEGEHIITLTVEDSHQQQDSKSVNITVLNENYEYPEVLITQPENNSQFLINDEIHFTAEIEDSDDDSFTNENIVWTSNIDGFLSFGTDFSYSTLSANTHYIVCSVKDSDNLTGYDTVVIHIDDPENNKPEAFITNPSNGDIFQTDSYINLTGYGQDSEDGEIDGFDLKWYSSTEGYLGRGNSLTVSGLIPGEHLIILQAEDSGGRIGKDTVSVNIIDSENHVPEIEIRSPQNGASYSSNTAVLFFCRVTDVEDDNIPSSNIIWFSDQEGVIGYGDLVNSELSQGGHYITVTAEDSEGGVNSKTVQIIVTENDNTIPTVQILNPADGTEFSYNQEVVFRGSGYDFEDGELTGESLIWHSNLNGVLGYGTEITFLNLEIGIHTVTLIARDSEGASKGKTVNIIISDLPPNAEIVYPANNAEFNLNSSVQFIGTAADAEDGSIPPENIQWFSDVDGFLGSGLNITAEELSQGVHKITMKVYDSQQQESIDYIYVKVTDDQMNIEWFYTYGSPYGLDIGREVIVDNEGNYAIAGYTRYPDYQGWLLRIDSQGNIITDVKYRFELDVRFYGIKKFANSFIVVGHNELYNYNGNNSMIMKLNYDGSIVWNKTNYSFDVTDCFGIVIDENREEFFTVGSSRTTAGTSIKKCLWSSYEFDGTLNYSNTGSYADNSFQQNYAVCINTEGNYFSAGYYKEPETDYDGFITKINEDGELIWIKKYGTSLRDYFQDIISLDNGNCLAVGRKNGALDGSSGNGWIAEINSDGEIVDEIEYGAGEYSCVFRTVVQADDGAIYAAGFTSLLENTDERNIIILKIIHGEIADQKIFPYEANQDPIDIKMDNDGGLLLTGFSDPSGNQTETADLFVMKVKFEE